MTGGPFTSRRVGRRRVRVVDQGLENRDLRTKIVEIPLRLRTVRVHNGRQILARLLDPRDGVREGPLALVAGLLQLADVLVHGREAMQNLIALVGFDGVEVVQGEMVLLHDLLDAGDAVCVVLIVQMGFDLVELRGGVVPVVAHDAFVPHEKGGLLCHRVLQLGEVLEALVLHGPALVLEEQVPLFELLEGIRHTLHGLQELRHVGFVCAGWARRWFETFSPLLISSRHRART